jgi:uncharacterized Zn-binding protein involved in type VI secretion
MPPAARITDMHTCPMVTGTVPHVGGPIIPPCAPTVLIGYMPAARVSDNLTCVGPIDVIVSGSPTVLINSLLAARIGDQTAHGGVIVTGWPTVIIGDGGGGGGAGGAGAGGGGGAPTIPNSPEIRLALARAMVATGGSGDAADAELVAQQLALMPAQMLITMIRSNTRVVACRGSVTDYRTDLRGVAPRGWPPGSTWDTVPGAFTPDRNEVVIGTRGHGTPAGPHVPATGEGHGSSNLIVHESTHAYDHDTGGSASADFNTASTADAAALPAYERQPGSAGQQEAYAESHARHVQGGDGGTPNLQNYWNTHP